MTISTRALRGSVLIAVVVLIADQISKHWALSALSSGPIDLFWTLRLRLVFNPGMAFSQGQNLGPLIAVVSLFVIAALLVSVAKGSGLGHPMVIGLVVGGAAGNLSDRLFRGDAWLRGEVVDFIDLQWFPVFNIADTAINLGVILLLIGAIRTSVRGSAPDDQ
jgi:signal peptidase II